MNKVFPRIQLFQPDLIFISLGFDAHKLDPENWNHANLSEYDYFWFAQQIIIIANQYASGRISIYINIYLSIYIIYIYI